MTTGSASVALVMSVPFTVTLAMPASAFTWKVSVTVAPVASVTDWSSSEVIVGAESSTPVMTMSTVVVEPSLSVTTNDWLTVSPSFNP